MPGSEPPTPDLQQTLSDNGLNYYLVARDGNYFFKAVALNLVADSELWADVLVQNGSLLEMTTDHELLSNALRQVFVNELSGERQLMYNSYMEQVKLNLTWKRKSSCRMGITPAHWVIPCLWQWQPLSMPLSSYSIYNGPSKTSNVCNPGRYTNTGSNLPSVSPVWTRTL